MKINIIEDIQKKITSIYIILMIIVFPLYFRGSLFNIRHDKYFFFLFLSAVYVVTIAILNIPNKKNNGIMFYLNRISNIDIGFLLIILSMTIGIRWNISYNHFFDSNISKGADYFFFFTGIMVVICISKFFSWNDFIPWAFLAGPNIVYILAIINRCGIDPLGIYTNMEDRFKGIFLSTIGNIDYLSSYEVVTVCTIAVLFFLSGSKISKVVYGIPMTTGFIAILTACAESAFLGLSSLTAVLCGYSLYDRKRASNLFSIFTLFFLALLFVFFLKSQKRIEIWGICDSLSNRGAIIVEFFILIVIYFIFSFIEKHEISSGLLLKIYSGIIIIIIAAVLILFVVATKNNYLFDSNSIFNYFNFNDNWGTYRGVNWKRCIKVYKDSSVLHKLFGNGFGNTYQVYYEYDPSYVFFPNGTVITETHNVVLNHLISAGIIDVVLWSSIVLQLVRIIVFLLRSSEKYLIPLVFICVYFSQGMVNGSQCFSTPIFFIQLGITSYMVHKGKKKWLKK